MAEKASIIAKFRYTGVMTRFKLDQRLEADSLFVHSFAKCDLRLANDRRWPWLILVPRIADAEEWCELAPDMQHCVWLDVTRLATILKEQTKADRINIAMLGNIVSQLHIHVVARYCDDPNWPNPVWGFGTREPYRDNDAKALINPIIAVLNAD